MRDIKMQELSDAFIAYENYISGIPNATMGDRVEGMKTALQAYELARYQHTPQIGIIKDMAKLHQVFFEQEEDLINFVDACILLSNYGT